MKWFKDEQSVAQYIDTVWMLYGFAMKDVFKGYVYLISCGKYTKIGRARDVNKRLYQISTASPYEVSLLGAMEVENCVLLESILHSSFQDFRVKGECPKKLLDKSENHGG